MNNWPSQADPAKRRCAVTQVRTEYSALKFQTFLSGWTKKKGSRNPSALNFYEEFFGTYMSWKEFNFNAQISLKYQYLYIECPKAGCSTIKQRLNEIECEWLGETPSSPHPPTLSSPMIKPYQLSYDQLEKVFFSGDFFRFSFVRNPYERVLSAYLDKIVRKGPQLYKLSKRHSIPLEEAEALSFSRFLNTIRSDSARDMDKHWRPQSHLTFQDKLNFSLIGKLETFESDWKIFITYLRESSLQKDAKKIVDWHATSSQKKLDSYYTASEYSDVNAIYREDFERFDYRVTTC